MYYPHDFRRRGGPLYCEQVPVAEIADAVDTPVYVYSHKTLVDHLWKLQRAFRPARPLICFSVKANGNLAILRLLVRHGAGLDIVSGGELFKARRAGCPPSRIVFASVGKRPEEIATALRAGIFCFNVESPGELEAIDAIARRLRVTAPVALRVNPDVDAHTHRHITTGVSESKFGIQRRDAIALLRRHAAFPATRLLGVHLHIGSQITSGRPFLEAVTRAGEVIREGRRAGLRLPWLNLGGGLGIIYRDERPQTPQAFARLVLPAVQALGVRLILEPGRFIVGNAGVLVTRVLYLKPQEKRPWGSRRQFAIVDAGMSDLLRPALYDAFHQVVPVRPHGTALNGAARFDVVGPICESADVLARDRRLGALAPGDLLAVLGAGAYGSTMASNYNGRPRPAEVMVRGRRWAVIRRRETYRDLIRHDVMPREMLS